MPCPVVMLWIGPALGAVERACVKSVLRQGHALALYCYRPLGHVPAGVELRDAADILPESEIIRHRTGSVSLFSNRFRYELQRRGLGTWVDCDTYLLQPLNGDQAYILAEYEPGRITPGVLRMPPDSPMLEPLLALFEERWVPPWLPWRSRVAAQTRLLTTGRAGLPRMPWGSAGPLALTHYARRYGLVGLAAPACVYNPVPWQAAERIRDEPLESLVTPESVAIHLWNERIKAFKDDPAPQGSFLAQLQDEGGR